MAPTLFGGSMQFTHQFMDKIFKITNAIREGLPMPTFKEEHRTIPIGHGNYGGKNPSHFKKMIARRRMRNRMARASRRVNRLRMA